MDTRNVEYPYHQQGADPNCGGSNNVGEEWSGKLLHFHYDNMAVVAGFNMGSSRDNDVMQLLRCLPFIVAKFDFIIPKSSQRSGQWHYGCPVRRYRIIF